MKPASRVFLNGEAKRKKPTQSVGFFMGVTVQGGGCAALIHSTKYTTCVGRVSLAHPP
ncbi:hypothetical protein ESA_04198 [Cronobacter sakazakii ATCC BAA-894]|uniref:Uncharacterized protein n=1 Tax=Cronobacter sakazakii (strain ATCC BAA-894) TaxID=290339 RepID=A7MKP7_CROS8|nr:hypothetical protein ESA_04198 [Cronobacter sakazakii ATCC BAA-894]